MGKKCKNRKKSYPNNIRGEYPCETCERIFNFKSNLIRHQLVHNKNKVTYECPICLNVFTRKSYLKLHVKRVHSSSYSFQCHICNKKFKLRNSLVAHLKYLHDKVNNKFICDYCKKDFNKKGNLQFHIMYSPCNPNHFKRLMVKCPYCDNNYLSTSLRTHYNTCPVKFERKRIRKQRQQRKNVACKPARGTSKPVQTIACTETETPLTPITSELITEETNEHLAETEDNSGHLRRSGRKRRVIDYRIFADLDVLDDSDRRLLILPSDSTADSASEVLGEVTQIESVFKSGMNVKVEPTDDQENNFSLLDIGVKCETESADNVSDTSEVKTDLGYLEFESTEEGSVDTESSVKDEDFKGIKNSENEKSSLIYSEITGFI